MKNSVNPNLPNMPKVVMEEVLKNLDLQSIFRLRKVCRVLRLSIDRIEPKLHVYSLSFQLPLTKKSLDSYVKGMSKYNRMSTMEWTKPRTGCNLKWKSEDTYRYSNISMEDVDTLLKNTKMIMDQLNIDLLFTIDSAKRRGIKKMEKDLKKFYESLKSLLENRGQRVETKRIVMHVHNLSEAAEFLEYTNPKSLKAISIQIRRWESRESNEMNFSEIEALELWKKNGMEKLSEMKELFIRLPNMKRFIIEPCELEVMKDQLLSYFGEFGSYEEEFLHTGSEGDVELQSTWIWLKDVHGSTDKLEITLRIGWRNDIIFSKV